MMYGDCGSGKTTTALQFPRPVVIDLEGGTDHYGSAFQFDVQKATEADEIVAAVDWLLVNPHPYRTLVIDPITLFWDSLQRKWSQIFLKRNKGSKGHRFEYYDLQPRDWQTVKAEFKEFVRKLIQLDMNVIVTARQKPLYSDGAFMKVIGDTFDGEKSLPYLFDTIIRLSRDDQGRFLGHCLKDRSNSLPVGEFEISYPILEGYFGRETLDREAVPLKLATEEQVTAIRHFIDASGIEQQAVQRRLAAYGADSVESLTEENAARIIQKFQQAAASDSDAASTQDEE